MVALVSFAFQKRQRKSTRMIVHGKKEVVHGKKEGLYRPWDFMTKTLFYLWKNLNHSRPCLPMGSLFPSTLSFRFLVSLIGDMIPSQFTPKMQTEHDKFGSQISIPYLNSRFFYYSKLGSQESNKTQTSSDKSSLLLEHEAKGSKVLSFR